jgi:hypothetical protein
MSTRHEAAARRALGAKDETALRIIKGVKALDFHRDDDWPRLIDLERLEMSDGCDCVLGQLYGFYNDGIEALSRKYFEGRELGLYVDVNADEEEWHDLTERWRLALAAMQEGATT